jgi:hypothetical protein
MEIYQIDDGQLFISPAIDDWRPVIDRQITVIFDLDDDLDKGVPGLSPDRRQALLYLYFPFEDRDLPDLKRLHAMAKLGTDLIREGYRVLSHCGMGHNRSALLAGLILTYLGVDGGRAVEMIQLRRRGALYNVCYAGYLRSLSSADLPLGGCYRHHASPPDESRPAA